jgi:hypothetical protein
MINNLKQETQKSVFDLKEDMNKQLNELKKNTNKWMKLRKLSKICKRNQYRYGNSEKQLIWNKQLNLPNKYSVDSLANRVEQVENREYEE